MVLQATENTPAGSGTPNPLDPHFLDGLEEEGTWPLRAIWALITGQPEPSDVPRHIKAQRERDALEREQKELERQKFMQEWERFNREHYVGNR